MSTRTTIRIPGTRIPSRATYETTGPAVSVAETAHPATGHDQIDAIAGAALAWTATQQMLTQSRCIDVLLDLYQASDHARLRWAVAECLSDIRFVGAVPAVWMTSELRSIVELSAALCDGDGTEWCDGLVAACLAHAA